MPADEEEGFQVPLVWLGFEESTVNLANQFVSQFEQGTFFISIGQVTPPLLLGPPEEQREMASQLPFLPVQTLARFAVTPGRLRDLMRVLETNVASYERLFGPIEEQTE
ncbi:MAG: hypothetical protein ACRDZ3_22850 [Acidimicrobiia bacterium]